MEYRADGRTVAEKIRQVQRRGRDINLFASLRHLTARSSILNRRAMVELAVTNSGGK